MGISLSRLRAVGVLKQVARWLAISHAQKRIHVRFGIPEDRIKVLYHSYDRPILESPPAEHVRGRDVLFVGRLSPEKGVHLLIEAWQMIGIRDRILWIAGDGPSRGPLEALAKTDPSIRFTGPVQEEALEHLWRNAAVLVVPSIWEEAFGRVLLESWAHRVLVVAARAGALPELIELTGAGWLFERGSSSSLAGVLESLLNSEAAISDVAAKCNVAISEFSSKDWLARIDAILGEVTVSPKHESPEASRLPTSGQPEEEVELFNDRDVRTSKATST